MHIFPESNGHLVHSIELDKNGTVVLDGTETRIYYRSTKERPGYHVRRSLSTIRYWNKLLAKIKKHA